MKAVKVFKYVGFGILGVAFIFFVVYLVMLLWNALVPELFNGPVLSYWQTAGIIVLSKFLLSGIGSGRGGSSHKSNRKWKSSRYYTYHRKDERADDDQAEVVME